MSAANLQKREATPVVAERVRSGRTYVPSVDIVEKPEELLLVADVPGVRAEDIDVSYERGELRLSARVEPRQGDGTQWLAREYGIGDFVWTFQVGEGIDASKIAAEVTAGVLTLHLPKAEAAKMRKIAVKASTD